MMNSGRETLFALLSAGGRWDACRLAGLTVRPDGQVELARVPAVTPSSLAPPAAVAPSGLALDARCGLYISAALERQVIRVSLDCGDRLVFSGDDALEPPLPAAPAGLCTGPFGWLFAADPGRGAVLVFHPRELSLRDEWRAGLAAPVAVASDRDRGLFVLDQAAGQVLRFDPWGRPDRAFARRMSPDGPGQPLAIAAGREGKLYVGDVASRSVLVFGPDGSPAGSALAAGTVPQALAVSADRLYVGDRESGEILICPLDGGPASGAVAGFRGPVSALAADQRGRLYIKTGGDAGYLVAEPAAGRLIQGTLQAGPLDAGEDSRWLRMAVEAVAPAGTRVLAETATAAEAATPPDWTPASAPDLLLDGERFLWIRITLERLGPVPAGTTSPSLAEVRAQTEGETYLDYLPLVYARAASDFLRRLLALARSELGDLEDALDQLPRRFDIATAPAATLPALAGWQAFPVPPRLARPEAASELRAVLAALPELYLVRGTPHGVARLVEICTKVRPLVFESFRTRGAWMLDGSAALGFDTTLPASAPDGIVLGASVVGASAPEDPETFARAVFDTDAHRFTVAAPAGLLRAEDRGHIGAVLDSEKPAHTQYHLCLWEPRFRVGVQARVGMDAIVAGPHEGLALDEGARLGLDTRISDEPTGSPGALGRRARLGVDTVVG